MSGRTQKKQVVQELQERLSQAKSVVFVDYCGLNVGKITDLRARLRAAGAEMKVFKNTLAQRAVTEFGVEALIDYLEGPTAGVFSNTDPVAGPQVLKEFARKNKKLVIKGGSLEKKVLDSEGVKALADLPSREVLLTQVVMGLQAPLAGLLNVWQGPQRQFVYALEAFKEKKEQA